MQEFGREIAKALWFDEGIPFDGYVILDNGRHTVFRLFLGERPDGALIHVSTVVSRELPMKVITQALRFYAEGALA